MAYLLGYDIGSSSIKASLINAETGHVSATAASPEKELPIQALQSGWAEQDPEEWWKHVILATRQILSKISVDVGNIEAIGLSYQMHGLILVDRNYQPLRPAIIWCDSRAVEIGQKAFFHVQCLVPTLKIGQTAARFSRAKHFLGIKIHIQLGQRWITVSLCQCRPHTIDHIGQVTGAVDVIQIVGIDHQDRGIDIVGKKRFVRGAQLVNVFT